MVRYFLTLLLLVSLATSSSPPVVVSIPEVSAVYNKTWYSGYLDLDNSTTHMHYFFFPSQRNKDTDNLLFWFNGGPGCSSLLGAMYEHGPFLMNDAYGSIVNNPFAWNQKANVVYIESPAQVGFSFMDGKAPTWNDDMVAKLNAKAVTQFFRVWPEFQGKNTYIAGQSYGGIYVPTVFYELHSNPEPGVNINLKGFAIGNGCTDPSECEFQSDYGVYQMSLWRDLGMITKEFYSEIQGKCRSQRGNLTKQCTDLMDKVDEILEGINIYDAFRPCYQNTQANNKITSFKELKRLALRKKNYKSEKLTSAPPCVDSVGIDKLLRSKVNRQLMGIPDKALQYSMCNDDADFDYDRSTTGSYWVYQKLVPLNKYKILIYSGDSDPAVPFAGTEYWINKMRSELQLATEEYWRPWFTQTTNGKQNSGSIWTLSNKFKLVTFKGIGHMAPQWNYQGGSKMINNLVNDEEI